MLKETTTQPTVPVHSCHEKVNTILKSVLRKLEMDRKVEMKAYSMVKEMLEIKQDYPNYYNSK